jgi:hypothetical protein
VAILLIEAGGCFWRKKAAQPAGQAPVLLNFTAQFFVTMGILRQLAEYLYIKKKDPNAPSTKWMRYMHGINRISLMMFVLAIIVIIVKLLFFKRH